MLLHNGCPLNVNALVEQTETVDVLLLYKYVFKNGSQLVWETTVATKFSESLGNGSNVWPLLPATMGSKIQVGKAKSGAFRWLSHLGEANASSRNGALMSIEYVFKVPQYLACNLNYSKNTKNEWNKAIILITFPVSNKKVSCCCQIAQLLILKKIAFFCYFFVNLLSVSGASISKMCWA